MCIRDRVKYSLVSKNQENTIEEEEGAKKLLKNRSPVRKFPPPSPRDTGDIFKYIADLHLVSRDILVSPPPHTHTEFMLNLCLDLQMLSILMTILFILSFFILTI